MNIILIDNYDSFTFNLFQLFAGLGAHVDVIKNDAITAQAVIAKRPTHIILSPGPGNPDDAGVSNDIAQLYTQAHAPAIPLLGVCLGHQCIARAFTPHRNPIRHAPTLMHGKVSRVHHDRAGIMHGIPSPFTAARYHSLVVDALPADFTLMCWTTTPKIIMGMRHTALPVFGVQFHPESFLTEHGEIIANNFLNSR